jgi:hypothetical protein
MPMEKYILGKFAYLCVVDPLLFHKILIKNFTNCGLIKYFECTLNFKESSRAKNGKFNNIGTPGHEFDFKSNSMSSVAKNVLFKDLSTKEIIHKAVTILTKEKSKKGTPRKDWLLIPVRANFGRDANFFHQCMFIVKLKSSPDGVKIYPPTYEVRYFDPYGVPSMYGKPYEHCVISVIDKLFNDKSYNYKMSYEESNVGMSIQTKTLFSNNKKFEKGLFDKDLSSVDCFTDSMYKKLMKENIDDERDHTIASLNVFSRMYLSRLNSGMEKTCLKHLYELFYKYSSKTCVSLTLICLHKFVNGIDTSIDISTENILDYIEKFITPTVYKKLLDLNNTNIF